QIRFRVAALLRGARTALPGDLQKNLIQHEQRENPKIAFGKCRANEPYAAFHCKVQDQPSKRMRGKDEHGHETNFLIADAGACFAGEGCVQSSRTQVVTEYEYQYSMAMIASPNSPNPLRMQGRRHFMDLRNGSERRHRLGSTARNGPKRKVNIAEDRKAY